MKHELIIIGGGASGIIAALNARNLGIDVAIIEANNRIGKKILTTGNGRCNITNKNLTLDRYHSSNSNFFEYVLTNFKTSNTIDFFKEIGLPLITLENNKMYPMSLQASSVIDILKSSLEERNIPIYVDKKVININKNKCNFKIHIKDSDEVYECRKLMLCCGGKSAPKTGSDGSGFNLAKELGHNIIEPIPALVQLKLNYKKLKALSGIKFDGIGEIFIDKKSKRKELGEILFTDYGISGPPILQLSRYASLGIATNKNVTLKIDMMPHISKDDLKNFLEIHWGIFGYRSIHDSFIGILNKKIIPVILKESGIENIHKSSWELTWQEKENLFKLLKEWEYEVVGTNGFNNAQVTAGGIDTKYINPKTLESKIVPNLYFAGEILDVDGDCGGFNLQWAWSSGIIASKGTCIK